MLPEHRMKTLFRQVREAGRSTPLNHGLQGLLTEQDFNALVARWRSPQSTGAHARQPYQLRENIRMRATFR